VAALNESKKLWDDAHDAAGKRAAVLALLGAKLGLPASANVNESFSSLGGNSFVAMQTIGAVRSLLGVAVPIFELLTKTFGDFADSVVAKSCGDVRHTANEWVALVDESHTFGKVAALKAPTFVFFPQAGSSPKQYAPLFTELKKRCSIGRYLFIQPPGRDARVDEPSVTDTTTCITQCAEALKPYLVGPASMEGPVIFIGDSWGAIAAFATAHELFACCGFAPDHMLVSGNASPAVTSTHMGLGSFSSKPMNELSDADLVDFLKASGVEDDKQLDKELLHAFRADCELYENYTRPANLPPLPSKLYVMRGKDDDVVSSSEVCGWIDEFDCEEAKFVRVPNATHHVHEEQPGGVADHIMSFVGLSALKEMKEVRPAANSPAKKKGATLAPPMPFVRGVDPKALQSFREGNLLYRMGAAFGSKGQLSDLPECLPSPAEDTGGSYGIDSIRATRDTPPREHSVSPY